MKFPLFFKLFSISILFAIVPVCVGHGLEEDHVNADAYLADQARAKEEKLSYLIDHFQQDFAQNLKLLSLRVGAELIRPAYSASGNLSTDGQWSPITTWPFAFASAANLPDGRILAWGGNNPYTFNGGNYTYAAIWDPVTNQINNVNHPAHSLFCGVPVMLEDGRVFVAGGDNSSTSSVKGTSTFNFKTKTWTRIQDMAVGRWYNGSVFLPNGNVFTAVGDPGSTYPEMWTQSSGWSYLTNASVQNAILNHPTITEPKNWLPHLHLMPNGQIYHSGHTPDNNIFDTGNNGNVIPLGLKNDWNTANTPSVLYDEGKILNVGGALYDANNTSTNKAVVYDVNNSAPNKTVVNNMLYPRIFHNEVILPNGEVMVVGGNSSGLKFNDTGSQYIPEIWNPVTKLWRSVAAQAVPRNYHSVALLMADGRVWSGGGGLCGCAADHPNSQVFSPPYLFNADGSAAQRPEINIAPTLVSYGHNINVSATGNIAKFSLIRMSSTTHALNSDVRFLNVPFAVTSSGDYTLKLHTNRNVMTPGYWMLFAINDLGVPSIAKIIQVSTSDAPVIQPIANQSAIVNTAVNVNVQANDPNGNTLTFDAIGLPQGLIINSATGQITGRPTVVGISRVSLRATDGAHTASVSFNWKVSASQVALISSPIYGGAGSTPFADSVSSDKMLIGVKIQSGGWLDSIQAIMNTGAILQHGGTGGTTNSFSLAAGEYLVRIYGFHGTTFGDYISKLSFVTNTGRVFGPYGNSIYSWNSQAFDFTVPVGNEIVGFTGRAGGYLDAIGVVYRLRQIPNQPPLITTVADQTNYIGDAVNLKIAASDADNDTLIYSASGLPTGLVINSTTGSITGTPTSQSSNDVFVKVQDSRGASSAINFLWSTTFKPIALSPITTTPQVVNGSVTLTASAPNSANPRYKWSFGDGSAETAYSSSSSITHTFANPGIFQVKVTVTDDNGSTDSTTFGQAIYLPHTASSPSSSTNIAVSSGGNQLWVVNQDNDSVSVFNTSTNAKLAEVPVGKGPRSIAQAPNGFMWVTNKYDATISIISNTSFAVQQTIKLPFASQPYGLVFSANTSNAYVVLESLGQILKLDSSTANVLGSVNVGSNPRHISMTGDGGKILVSRFITRPMPGEDTASVQTVEGAVKRGGEIVVVNGSTFAVSNTIVLQHSDQQDTSTRGAGIPNYLHAAVISPDGQTAWVSSKQDNIKRGTLRNGNNLNFQNTVRGIASKLNLVTLSEHYSDRIDFDNTGLASAISYDKSGNYLFVALEATREVAIVDAYSGIVLNRINVGRTPDGLALSADGKTLYVNNFMDRSISVVDLTNILARGDWTPPVVTQLNSVAQEKLTTTILKGKQYFYDAKDTRLARDGYLSCAVCHNDGGHDGRVWDLTGMGEGLRNTIDLRGRSGIGHGLLHWSANFDEIQDFEGQIRNLASGTGLMSDADFSVTSSTLGTAKAGRSADLDELAAYVSSLTTFAPSPHRNGDGSLTSLAMAGKAIFIASGCTQCHSGDTFTDSPEGESHSIGTIKPSSGQRLGGDLIGLDTPTLRDIWNTAPYLHDGSAPTIEAAISAHDSALLNAGNLAAVSAYVRQIGDSDTIAQIDATNVSQSSTALGGIATRAVDGNTDGNLAHNSVTYTDLNANAWWQMDLGGSYALNNITLWGRSDCCTSRLSNFTVFVSTADLTGRAYSDIVADTTVWRYQVNGTAPSSLTLPVNAIGRYVRVQLAGTNYLSLAEVKVSGVKYTQVPVSMPDLIVTNLSYTNGVFTSTIKNQGETPIPSGVWIGVGYYVDGLYKTFGNVKGPLAPGASATLGTVTPYMISNGLHTIKAWVDDANKLTESDVTNNQLAQTIQVSGSDVTPPVVAINAPAGGVTVSGSAVVLSANASDNIGVTGVQFKLDGVNLGAEVTSLPYTLTWNTIGVIDGHHILSAIARDADGNTAASTPVSVTVNNSGQTLLPDVIVTDFSYSNGVFTSTIKNQGTLTTPAGISIGIGYFVDGVYKTYGSLTAGNLAAGTSVTIGTNGGTYNIPNGSHTISAMADDINRFPELNETNNQLSKVITINLVDSVPPTININDPVSGTTLPRSTLTITASAADNIGVTGVQFKLDGANLGSKDTTAPYSISFNTTNVADGTHTLTAVAQDLVGNTTTSSNVVVTVNNSVVTTLPDTIVTAFSYSNGVFSSTVKNQGSAATPAANSIGVSYYVNGVYKTYGSYFGSLAAGASVTIGTTGPAYTISSGTVTISAKSDDINRFAELDETNNQLSESIVVH